MTQNNRHMTWDNLQALLFVPNEERTEVIKGFNSPDLILRTSGVDVFGLLIPCVEAHKTVSELKTLENIRAEAFIIAGREHIFFFTSKKGLAKAFHGMLLEIADLIQLQEYSPQKAILSVTKDFENLILEKKILTEEKQKGLYGELLTLKQLITIYGDKAIDYWTGPTKDPHDFRFRNIEIEVKTSSLEARIHTVRLGQMEPSVDHNLYLHSIHLAASADGRSLVNVVRDLRQAIQSDTASEKFEQGLLQNAYLTADEHHYKKKYLLRSDEQLIPIDKNFPAITRSLIYEINNSERIKDVSYQIDVGGLGFPKNSKDYELIFKPKGTNVNA